MREEIKAIEAVNNPCKLNVGCGTDYRDGFINIDGSSTLPKIDKHIVLPSESLLSHFKPDSVDFVLCQDFIEHHFHWEAVKILTEFYAVLRPGGKLELRYPDVAEIIKSKIPTHEKIKWLYGGQDVPGSNKEMNLSRRHHPQFFCHKFGWARESMHAALLQIGFTAVTSALQMRNSVTTAVKT